MFDSTYAILFCVVYGSLVNFCWAKTLNLADHLSDHEKLELFGSHEVPEHQILETSWSRHRRDDENIVLLIDILSDGRPLTVTLRPTDGLLMAEHTPVWKASWWPGAENSAKYEVLYHSAPKQVGKYRCYHDLDTEAAVTVFYDENNVGTMEGMINYDVGLVIKSVPLTGSSQTLNYKNQQNRIPNSSINVRPRRSVSQDDESWNVTTNYHVIFKRPSSLDDTIKNVEQVVRREVSKRSRREVNSEDSVVYPEILVIADVHWLMRQSYDVALKAIIAHWNAIDLPFSRLTNPRVRPTIAGVLIIKDIFALEGIPTKYYDLYDIVPTRLDRFRRDVGSQHPIASELNLCDMVMIMANVQMYNFSYYKDQVLENYLVDGEVTGVGESCPTTDPKKPNRFYPGVGIYRYDRDFTGVDSGIMQLARLLGSHDDVDNTPDRCDTSGGFAMSTLHNTPHRRKMAWSDCSVNFFRNHLNSPAAACLKNKSRWTVLEYDEDAN